MVRRPLGGWAKKARDAATKAFKASRPEKPRNPAISAANKAEAIKALRNGRCLTLTYDGLPRMVEVHTVGDTRSGRAVMSVYQVGGQSRHLPTTGWRMMHLDECFEVALSDYRSAAPRRGYRKGAKGFRSIEAEV